MARRRWEIVSYVSAGAWTWGCLFFLLWALFQRLIALPIAPRLLTLLAFGAGSASCVPRCSEIGQPNEALLFTAALLVGELLGHPIELHRRLAFMQAHAHALQVDETRRTQGQSQKDLMAGAEQCVAVHEKRTGHQHQCNAPR